MWGQCCRGALRGQGRRRLLAAGAGGCCAAAWAGQDGHAQTQEVQHPDPDKGLDIKTVKGGYYPDPYRKQPTAAQQEREVKPQDWAAARARVEKSTDEQYGERTPKEQGYGPGKYTNWTAHPDEMPEEGTARTIGVDVRSLSVAQRSEPGWKAQRYRMKPYAEYGDATSWMDAAFADVMGQIYPGRKRAVPAKEETVRWALDQLTQKLRSYDEAFCAIDPRMQGVFCKILLRQADKVDYPVVTDDDLKMLLTRFATISQGVGLTSIRESSVRSAALYHEADAARKMVIGDRGYVMEETPQSRQLRKEAAAAARVAELEEWKRRSIQMQMFFQTFDPDRSGFLATEDFAAYMALVHGKKSMASLVSRFAPAETGAAGVISYAEFEQHYLKCARYSSMAWVLTGTAAAACVAAPLYRPVCGPGK